MVHAGGELFRPLITTVILSFDVMAIFASGRSFPIDSTRIPLAIQRQIRSVATAISRSRGPRIPGEPSPSFDLRNGAFGPSVTGQVEPGAVFGIPHRRRVDVEVADT